MKNDREYQVCTRCVMDTTASEIEFDDDGVCSFCHDYDDRKKTIVTDPVKKKLALDKIIDDIKKSGKNKEYDCIIGVSGGVDSSYVAYMAKKFGLRGLLVHLDNGWDSELAVKNIENIIEYTGFDLYTLVIDWDEFKDLQRSFFMSDVIDLELLSDHAIFATVYRLARKYKVKYLLSGENFETEAIMPKSWNWRKSDAKNIKAIHKLFGSKKLKTFPFMSTLVKIFYQYGGIAKSVPILDYLNYNKDDVMRVIQDEMSWKYYGGKHYESIFTRFYQGYILPNKFNVDKRKAHLSTLINSGQISKEKAVSEMAVNEYFDTGLYLKDMDLLIKKLSMSQEFFKEYIKAEPKSHLNYGSDQRVYALAKKVSKLIYDIK